uniref:Uncharacterized protein LOC111124059 n=1 Tax=Crassostrea virginica TaxID=6565 RepID=A0A8B8D3G2_CRAVI|nr:uncharacterized protein LOC111124059 [Crassostrea virginica]
MDPTYSAQDVARCDLCKTAIAHNYCDFCHVNLCKPCIGEHISDEYDKHKIVPILQRKSTLNYPKCEIHQNEVCQYQCKDCNIFVCSHCFASKQHKEHEFLKLEDSFSEKKKHILKDREELEEQILPTYEEIAIDLENQISNLDGEYKKLTSEMSKQREEKHREVDNAFDQMELEIGEIKVKHHSILQKHLDEIKQLQSLMQQTMKALNEIEESNEVTSIIHYSSKYEQFSKLPPKVHVSMPKFIPKQREKEQLCSLIGKLTPLSTKLEERVFTAKKPTTSVRELLDEPEVLSTIKTGHEHLRSVTCLNAEQIWSSGKTADIKCFKIQGVLQKTIKSKSGGAPNDIAVDRYGAVLLYIDWRTVYKVKNDQTVEIITLQGWVPVNLCVTSSGDLLVTMYSDDKTQSKVVCYSGSTVKQTIQFDEEGQLLYSGNDKIKYISENRNLDICVADWGASAVVVVNQSGKLRFRYTGPPSSTKNKPFRPYCITTDSQSRILTSDGDNHCIHILDTDGQFLRYIDNCDLGDPYGLCLDGNDSLYVCEYYKGNVKKIRYSKASAEFTAVRGKKPPSHMDQFVATMDPDYIPQDVARCDLCKTAIAHSYCDFCHVNLCKLCIGEHIPDEYDKHKIVSILQRKFTLNYPKCEIHQNEVCQYQCKDCNIFVCSHCLASKQHKEHEFLKLEDSFSAKKKHILKDREELEEQILPTYEEIAIDLENQITNLDGEYKKLTSEMSKQREEIHREIDNAFDRMELDTGEIKVKHHSILQKHLDEIKQLQSLMQQTLKDLNEIEESNEVISIIHYSSKNEQFSKIPPKVHVSMPKFIPKQREKEELCSFIGKLTPLSTTLEERVFTAKKPNTSVRELLDETEVLNTIKTGHERLRTVTCLYEEQIWTSGETADIKCFNIQGVLQITIKTKSGKAPNDIAVYSDGALVYSDWRTRTVYKVKNDQTEEIITLQGWKPTQLCVTSSGDLLVTMFNDDETQSKVVRYSESTVKQTIQFDDEGQPLYSGNNSIKYISENRNLDICVADSEANAVVVVNQAGKFRFRYTGPLSSTKNESFKPFGITTDSQSRILTSDCNNHCIHILDTDGQFLCYINNCDLEYPYGLCVDSNDSLFVCEIRNGNMKKITYSK